jgi:hypothetical protein
MAGAPWEFLRVINGEQRGNWSDGTGGPFNLGVTWTARTRIRPQMGRPRAPAADAVPVHKYLIGRGGDIAAVFAANSEPMDARVIAAIMKELAPLE